MKKNSLFHAVPTTLALALVAALGVHSNAQATGVIGPPGGASVDAGEQAKLARLKQVPAAPMLVTHVIDNAKRTAVHGSVRALANSKNDAGAATLATQNQRISVHVLLKRDAARETALENYLAATSDASSPLYQKWVTAKELGQYFGPAQSDTAAVADWLKLQGLTATVEPSGMIVDASGTVAQLAKVFQTTVHQYKINGELRFANTDEVKLPAAIATAVDSVTSLDNFRPVPLHTQPRPLYFDSKSKHWLALKAPVKTTVGTGTRPQPEFSVTADNQQLFLLGPQDFSTIYNVAPVRSQKSPLTGKGHTVTLLGASDAKPSDWLNFRAQFGLSQYKSSMTIVHPGACTAPGFVAGVATESALDVEAVGFAAPEADVVLASCEDLVQGATNLVNQDTPPEILSFSYGTCEANDSASAKAFTKLWQQAAAEGTSVFVSSGDQLGATCDRGFFGIPTPAFSGLADNAWGDSAYNVSVGGTDFSDFVDNTILNYWSLSNNPGASSALSYAPEIPWNESCASSVLYTYEGFKDGLTYCNSATAIGLSNAGGSGGQSANAKPSWQAGITGIVADKTRDTPDVSLFAAGGLYSHAIPICDSVQFDSNGNLVAKQNLLASTCNYGAGLQAVGGTSFSSPAFAGIQALINQKKGKLQGNPNPRLYALATTEFKDAKTLAGCDASKGNKTAASCVFHDVTRGDIDSPCYAGTPDCYVADKTQQVGILSTSPKVLKAAYPATKGWDFATGLGSVNVDKLINAW